jgi:hypothetical protein
MQTLLLSLPALLRLVRQPVFLVSALISLALFSPAHAAETGAVTGSISNAGTGNLLEGANSRARSRRLGG